MGGWGRGPTGAAVAAEDTAAHRHGRNLRQRAELLISIAAPELLEELERAAFAAFS